MVEQAQVSNIDDWLVRNGFKKTTRPGWTVWNFVAETIVDSEKDGINHCDKKSFHPKLIWKINHIEVTERKGVHQVSTLSMSLDFGLLKRAVSRAAKKFYGARTTVTIVDSAQGSFWVFLEFIKSATKKTQIRPNTTDFMPYGVAGFKVGIGCSSSIVEVYFSEFFGIGFVPQVFISSHMKIINEALGLKKIAKDSSEILTRKSLFEFHISQNIAFSVLSGESAVPKALLCNRNKQNSLRLTIKGGQILFTFGQTEHAYENTNHLVVPLVTLESRESSLEFREIDELLVSGKVSRVSKKIVNLSTDGVISPFLSRRIWLMSLCGQIFPENLIAATNTGAKIEEKLYLSCMVRIFATKNEMVKVLDRLSDLGRILASDLPGIDSVKSFDLVIPELLGDAWNSTSPQKATVCFERILQRCGDLPRILRKMITIYEADSNREREFELLLRLSVVERRRNELAKVFYRLAELSMSFSVKRGNPLDFAFKSLQNDRNFYQSALLAANLLNQSGKPNEAIGLMDQMLSDQTIVISIKAKALLEFQIGETWHHRLGRIDLAERRYERSIELDPTNVDSLIQLEQVYRGTGQSGKVAALLEKQFDAYERNADVDNLKRIFEELVELYRGPMDTPQKGYELYQRMLALAIVEPEEIDKLMSWRDIEIDWHSIYSTLVSNLNNIPDGDLSATYHIRMAEICRDKLEDSSGAYKHYLASLNHGAIDANGFRMIVEKLALEHSYEHLATCFETRLRQVRGQDRVELILEILSFPSILSDSRRDQLAIEAFITDNQQSTLLFQRIKFYQSMDDVDGLNGFALSIVQWLASSNKASVWLKYIIESLLECIDPAKYSVVDRIFRELLTFDLDSQGLLAEAISLFKESTDPGKCVFYVRELLKINIIPELAPKLVARYLVGYDADLAKFHYLRAQTLKEVSDIATDARLAFAIFKRLVGQQTTQEKCLHLLGGVTVISSQELRELKSIATATGNWTELARTLQKQAELTDDLAKKHEILIDQGMILWKELKEFGRARLSFVMAMNTVENKSATKFVLAQLAEDSGQPEQELRALIDYVLDENSGDNLLNLKNAVVRMLALGKEPYAVYKLVKSKLVEMSDNISKQDLLGIVNTFIASGFLNQDLFQISFKMAINACLFDEAIEFWWLGLKSVQNRTGFKSYLSETKSLLESLEREDLLLKCFNAATGNGVIGVLPEKVRQEVLVEHGLLLFDSDLRRGKSLPIFKEAYRLDRFDNRIWLPIYFILEEQGDIAQQFLFLKEMIVLLREDQRPLRMYPVTIESLESQLRELANQLGEADLGGPFSYEERSSQGTDEFAGSNQSPDEVMEQQVPLAMVSGDLMHPVDPLQNPRLHLAIAPDLLEANSSGHESDTLTNSYDLNGVEEVTGAMLESYDAEIYTQISPDVLSKLHSVSDQNQHSDVSRIELNDTTVTPLSQLEVQISLENTFEESASCGTKGDFSDGSPSEDAAVSTIKADLALLDLGARSDEFQPIELQIVGLDLNYSESGIGFLDLGMASATDVEDSQLQTKSSEHSVDPNAELPHTGIPLPQGDEKISLNPNQIADISLDIGRMDEVISSVGSPELEPNLLKENYSVDQEVSSIELAAALDIKAVLLDDEYSSVELRNSGSIFQAMRSELASSTDNSIQGSIQKVNAGLEAEDPNATEAVDWRNAILTDAVTEDLTKSLMKQAFANEIEKHLALQCVALIAGNCHFLEGWHWRVWRSSKEYGYQLNGRERFNSELTSSALQTRLHQFIIACNPLMAKVFRENYTIDHLSKILGTSTQYIERAKKQRSWHEGLLNDVGFHLYRDRIEKRGYKVFNLPGLGGNLFFEGPHKSVYFDEAFFKKQPPGALFHRVLSLLWSIRLQYYIPLALNPRKQVFPFLVELHQKLDIQGISKLTEKIKSRSPLAKHLSSVDLRTLQSLKAKSGVPTEAQVSGLWFAMQEHIFKLILSETLDVVGLFEAILSRDLTASNSLKPKEIFARSPYTKSLLSFATKIIV